MQFLFIERVLVFSVDESNSLDEVFEVRVSAEFSPCVATISFPGWRQLEVPVDDCVA